MSDARGEFDFIERLRRLEHARQDATGKHSTPATRHASLLKGIGDDAAVFRQRAGFDTVVTADMLVEGVDFRLQAGWTSPRDLGHKALAVSLSDVAAMGARPRFCLLSVGVPRALWRGGFAEEFYRGVRALARLHGVRIIGGDTSRTPGHVVVDSVVLGEVRRGRALTRAGARAGDQIFVTGSLGGAAAGLKVLESRRVRNRRPGSRRALPASSSTDALTRAERGLVRRQTRPVPRVEWGALLGERGLASALIDLSDGLSSDLAHVCRESGVGARVDASLLPLDPLLNPLLKKSGAEDALALALDGGEDFELLFTVSPRKASRLPREVGGVHVTRVGEVTGERGKVRLVREGRARLLRPGGFEHFGRD
ncbi:MAG TPA: thiamine-phosphate kinase [Pyrinomonadaceae bacterium]|jgi:thiamine-monophosphate kinase